MLIGTIAGGSSWSELYLSEPFRENSVFKYAKFRTIEEIGQWNKEKHESSGECLFVPPLANDDDLNYENENNLSRTSIGGFVCAVWKK
ncbi:MAG TPA: hypothetical protein DEF04_11745 [Clostridiales bacterium]|nr:hypothetical protein [Clostridiales bacterium]